jgi:DAACS family dicarboxylate/amino acid:cation (Na+ or H+) symporter
MADEAPPARHRAMLYGIAIGATLGLVASELVDPEVVGYVVDYVANPLGQIFLRLLFMLAVPLIFSALVSGIAELDPRSLGKLGLKTLGYTTVVSILSVVIGLALVTILQPGVGDNTELTELAAKLAKDRPQIEAAKGTGMSGVVSMIPANPVAAIASGDTLGLIATTCNVILADLRPGASPRREL